MKAGGRITAWICRRRGHRWGEWREGASPVVEVRHCTRRRCKALELRCGPEMRRSLQAVGRALRSIDEQIRACAADIGRGLARGGAIPRPQIPRVPVQVISLPLSAATKRGIEEALQVEAANRRVEIAMHAMRGASS